MSNAASLNPDDFAEGGGLIDDVDVVFTECAFDMFDYNGKVTPGVPALKLVLELDEGESATQYYSMGNSQDWIPSDDGSQLLAVGKATSIKMTSNGGIFLKSLIDAGYPADELGDDISVLTGLQAHLIRVPAPTRPGIKKKEDKKFDDTILIVSEIVAMPGEKKTPKGAPAKKAAGKPAAGKKAAPAKKAAKKAAPKEEVVEEGGVEDKATTTLMEILGEAGSITKKELPAKIFQLMKDDPDRNAVVKLAFSEEFLSEGPWTYEDGTLIM